MLISDANSCHRRPQEDPFHDVKAKILTVKGQPPDRLYYLNLRELPKDFLRALRVQLLKPSELDNYAKIFDNDQVRPLRSPMPGSSLHFRSRDAAPPLLRFVLLGTWHDRRSRCRSGFGAQIRSAAAAHACM